MNNLQYKQNEYPEPSELTVSTCTVVANLNNSINLNILSRIIPIYYDSDHIDLEKPEGGITNITLISDYSRGNFSQKKGKIKEFNNQVTIIYKYWGFRVINIKIFSNGKTQMTGLKPGEAENITNNIINIIKKTDIKIYNSLKKLETDDINVEFKLLYNYQKDTINYYRNLKQSNLIQFIKFIDPDFNGNNWYSDIDINKYITTINKYFETFINQYTKILLDTSIDFNTLKDTIFNLNQKYKYIKFTFNYVNNINEDMVSKIKNDIKIFLKDINTVKDKQFKKIKLVRDNDNEICNKINLRLKSKISSDINIHSVDTESEDFINKTWCFNLNDLNTISNSYSVSNITTELINSDYHTNFTINLPVLSKLLFQRFKIFNSYKPDEYPGVLAKYYFNKQSQINDGICRCEQHCSIKEKKANCCKITISIFRPGSIIITGAKSIEQLKHTYSFINNILKNYFKVIKGSEHQEEYKNNIVSNEIRKISRKNRLYYVKHNNIIIN
tara:strand:- start:1128 stop:2627 length:1500 start_codon:yes stop_codon:yes gene_type:complete